jgi:CRISPR-associated protein Csm5
MMDIFERKKTRITTVSPVHIGSVEQKLTPFEYCRYKQFIYPVSEEKLSYFLQNNNLIDSYIQEVGIQGHQFRLLNYFRSKKINVTEQELLSISNERRVRLLGDAAHLQDYRPLIRDGFGNPYVPGTAIKGAIRTAILYNALSNFRSTDCVAFENTIVKTIEKTEPFKFKKRSPFEWIQREFLESCRLSDKNGSPHSDWLRMLHITDAYPVSLKETWLIPVNVLKKETTGWKYKTEKGGVKTTIWVECLPPGVSIDFETGWDCALLSSFQKENENINLPTNLTELMANIEQWSNNIFCIERDFTKSHGLENWYKTINNANFRIGFASGMMSTTMLSLLPEDIRKLVRNSAGKNKGDDVAPKSRRVWLKDDQPVPLGWSRLHFEPFDIETNEEVDQKTFSDNFAEDRLDVIEASYPLVIAQRNIPDKAPPEQIPWKNVTIVWRPNDQTLSATLEGKKAEKKIGTDKSFVPERLHKKLFEGKKHAVADIIVEPCGGNAFRIVQIELEDNTSND